MVNIMSKANQEVTLETTQLGPKATMAELIQRVNELTEKVNAIKVRDRGPKSERSMTDEDAQRVKFGDLVDASHKEAAAELGLSYGQVYSARGGYTFTHIKKEA